MKNKAIPFLSLLLSLSFPWSVHAQGAAPELFGVREVIVQYARFPDTKASDTCGLSREQIAATLAKALNGTGVPAIAVSEAKPPVMGVARIDLIPEIYSHADENLDCVSWVSLSAENHVNAVVPPITTLRSITALYWRQRTTVASPQSTHAQLIGDVIQKMVAQFAQQYRVDQPPEIAK